jgi:AraC family transcriptional regulator
MARLAAGSYLGARAAQLATGVAVATEVRHAEGRALPEHDHALDYFCMPVRGHYEETIEGRALAYAPFQVGFHPAGVPHRDRVGPAGARFVCLEIRADALDTAAVRLARRASLLPGDVTLRLIEVFRALCARTLAPVELDAIAWELCGDASPGYGARERATPRWLARCLALVEDGCAEPWTVDAAARAAGVHPVHLAREFRRRYGQTFGACLQKARIRAACARMAERDEPLAHTAAHAGFADQSHFCRVFKARVGQTPSAFAAMLRRDYGAAAGRYSM